MTNLMKKALLPFALLGAVMVAGCEDKADDGEKAAAPMATEMTEEAAPAAEEAAPAAEEAAPAVEEAAPAAAEEGASMMDGAAKMADDAMEAVEGAAGSMSDAVDAEVKAMSETTAEEAVEMAPKAE